MNVNQSVGLLARSSDSHGTPVPGQASWSTSNEYVATVDAEGFVTGVGQGTAVIQATIGGITGTTGVTVYPAGQCGGLECSISVSPYTPSAKSGRSSPKAKAKANRPRIAPPPGN